MRFISLLVASVLINGPWQTGVGQESRGASPGIVIQVIEGEGAINNVKRGAAFEPVIEVHDQNGKPVRGASVTFTLPATGPSATFPDGSKTLLARTDENGRVTARGMRPNTLAGEFDIRVSASDGVHSATITFTQTNAAPATAEHGSGKKWAILIGIAGGAAAAGLVALKGGSSPKTTPTVADPTAGVITPGAPGFGPPR